MEIAAGEGFAGFGLAGMFCAAFLAATILPLGSEAVLVWLLVNNGRPAAVIFTATLGNVLGSLVNYWMGRAGGLWLSGRLFKVSQAELSRALDRFRSWGTWGLLLAWLPVVGDPLTIAAGVLRVNLWLFLCLVTLGKLGRYLVLAAAVLAV